MYLRSTNLLELKLKSALQEFGLTPTGNTATVICKCRIQSEARQKAESAGLGSKWFRHNCCEQISDEEGLNLTKGVEMAVCVDGQNYLNVDEIKDWLLK